MEVPEAPESETPRIARCLWCGAERPVDVDTCPTCHNAWIDATIDEARNGRLEAMAPSVAERAPAVAWWRRWWMPVAVAGLAALIYGVVFWFMWDGTQPDQTATGTTLAPTTTLATPTSTEAPASTVTPAPTAAPTTTSTTTTTTTTTTTLPPIAGVPPAIDVADLTLGAFALGPLRFRAVDGDAAGRLVATFGQPDERFPVGENWGLCPTDTGRVLRWGHLRIILRDDPEGEALVGYRLTDEPAAADSTETLLLRSLSGLALGDGRDRLELLYANVVIDTLDDGTPVYLVLRSSDGRTLLWGTLSTDADPVVTSINSPRPCDGGPFAP
jgi:hypothetical protein